MYYVLIYKKTNKWKLYRRNGRILIYNKKEIADSDARELEKTTGYKFAVKEIKIHPKSRGSSLWGKKWRDVL